jgi:hypothetical protein
MKKGVNILGIGFIALVLLDGLGDLGAQRFHYKPEALWPLSFVIYFIIAFVGARRFGLKVGVLFASILGAFDATAGWLIDSRLMSKGANIPFTAWLVTMMLVTILAALTGLVAAALAVLLRRRRARGDTGRAAQKKTDIY